MLNITERCIPVFYNEMYVYFLILLSVIAVDKRCIYLSYVRHFDLKIW